MNLHLLRLFTAVVDHGGIVAAASALHLSQPAVSRAVRELERQLGLSLFERPSRRVRLTAEGMEVYAHARSVFAAERSVEEAIAALKGLGRGILRVGASTTIATYVLPPLIAEFARRSPMIELRLSAVHTRVIVRMLQAFDLDVALAEAPVTAPEITVTRWRTDEMVLIAAPTHRLAERPALAPADLADELFVLREPESGTRDIVLRALADAGIVPRRSMSIDGTEVIKQVVAEGHGVAIVSRVAIADQLASGRLVVLDLPGLHVTRPFWRLSVPGRPESSAARAFTTLLRPDAPAPDDRNNKGK